MANVSRRNGFRPTKSLIGAPWTGLVREYIAAAGRSGTNNSGDIYIGDVVGINASGEVEPMSTIGGAVLGVVVAVGTKSSDQDQSTNNANRYYDPDNLGKRYLAHDEEGYVGVVPAEACLFEVESNVVLVRGAAGDIGITSTAARGDRVTGNSTQFITTGTTGDVTVVEFNTSPANDPAAGNAKYIVKFNLHANAIN